MQRRYFSTALFRSPIAMSPLASSKISSGVAIDPFSYKSRNGHKKIPTANFKRTTASLSFVGLFLVLSFLELQASCLLPVPQPFDQYNALLVFKNSLFEGNLLLSSIGVRKRFS